MKTEEVNCPICNKDGKIICGSACGRCANGKIASNKAKLLKAAWDLQNYEIVGEIDPEVLQDGLVLAEFFLNSVLPPAGINSRQII